MKTTTRETNNRATRARGGLARRDWSALEIEAFKAGRACRLHERLGAHPLRTGGFSFGLWAPRALSVAVVGDFNDWDASRHPLKPLAGAGIWNGTVPTARAGERYKFRVESTRHGQQQKADPFAFRSEVPPATASVLWAGTHAWRDGRWMRERAAREAGRAPMSVYELHLGSWRRPGADGAALPAYREIADELIDHLRELGFTHVELMPLTEHPYYPSWGYQTTGYFAPTSRYGTPEELMALIDRLHQAGIGVILDWVPSHFPSDGHGLCFFDGTYLFEYPDPRVGYQPDWQSYVFNWGRGEVVSFLVSSALSWIERFHVDALRIDAVASMLYLDYSRKPGEWIENKHGGKENLEAIAFLRLLNETIHREAPGVLTIAEESTAWPMVSHPVEIGGLGFDMKWDMGWMNDTLEYMKRDPVHRKYHHNALTFRSMYAWSERFVLALSHDEVVHGKGSLAGKMAGDRWRKLANLRALYGWMYGQPGRKLLFMGAELAQWREWSHERQLDWELLDDPAHAGVARWVADLNRVYRAERALHELDFEAEGFAWIDCHDADRSIACFLRRSLDATPEEAELILVAANFTPVPRHGYHVGAPRPGRWVELLNSDAECYGGSGIGNLGAAETGATPWHGQAQSLSLSLPPLAVLFLKHGPAVATAGD